MSTGDERVPETPDDTWSKLDAVYGADKDEIRIRAYFHPFHKPLRFYLNGEEAMLVPVAKTDGGD